MENASPIIPSLTFPVAEEELSSLIPAIKLVSNPQTGGGKGVCGILRIKIEHAVLTENSIVEHYPPVKETHKNLYPGKFYWFAFCLGSGGLVVKQFNTQVQ